VKLVSTTNFSWSLRTPGSHTCFMPLPILVKLIALSPKYIGMPETGKSHSHLEEDIQQFYSSLSPLHHTSAGKTRTNPPNLLSTSYTLDLNPLNTTNNPISHINSTKAIMLLLHLPPEVFQRVVRFYVSDVGVGKAARAREVSSTMLDCHSIQVTNPIQRLFAATSTKRSSHDSQPARSHPECRRDSLRRTSLYF
jgi:hypothetical protein